MERYAITETVARGAEAVVSYGTYLDYPVVVKHRYAKTYRAPQIDNLLRKNRTIQEARLLTQAREVGVKTPYLLDVDKTEWILVMERIEGPPLKLLMDDIDITNYFTRIGKYMGILHANNIIHGDLTTSNIMIKDDEIYFIDFGLGFVSTQIEDYAVDILVLKHTLVSSHHRYSKDGMFAFYEGYKAGNSEASTVIKRVKKVESRIRYH